MMLRATCLALVLCLVAACADEEEPQVVGTITQAIVADSGPTPWIDAGIGCETPSTSDVTLTWASGDIGSTSPDSTWANTPTYDWTVHVPSTGNTDYAYAKRMPVPTTQSACENSKSVVEVWGRLPGPTPCWVYLGTDTHIGQWIGGNCFMRAQVNLDDPPWAALRIAGQGYSYSPATGWTPTRVRTGLVSP